MFQNGLQKPKQHLQKNSETRNPKNYRIVALHNIILKLYTSCINQYLQHHCEVHDIVTTEQGGGKKDIWSCLKQLQINKTIVEELKTNRISLVTMWLDYQKFFVSVRHKWLTRALEFAKVSKTLIDALKYLITKWSTKVHAKTRNGNIVTEEVKYSKGIFQGDSLYTVILFNLCVNPLSFLPNKMNGKMCLPSY